MVLIHENTYWFQFYTRIQGCPNILEVSARLSTRLTAFTQWFSNSCPPHIPHNLFVLQHRAQWPSPSLALSFLKPQNLSAVLWKQPEITFANLEVKRKWLFTASEGLKGPSDAWCSLQLGWNPIQHPLDIRLQPTKWVAIWKVLN